MWQIILETGYYLGARHIARGIFLVMIAFRIAKIHNTRRLSIDMILNGWADFF